MLMYPAALVSSSFLWLENTQNSLPVVSLDNDGRLAHRLQVPGSAGRDHHHVPETVPGPLRQSIPVAALQWKMAEA
jgi:hypothetical protein